MIDSDGREFEELFEVDLTGVNVPVKFRLNSIYNLLSTLTPEEYSDLAVQHFNFTTQQTKVECGY